MNTETMSELTMTWQDFLQDTTEFLKLSERLKDSWSWCQERAGEGNGYLVFKQKVPFPRRSPAQEGLSDTSSSDTIISIDDKSSDSCASDELLQIEYHIVYSISYQVPVLYFMAHKSDGSILQLEDAWRLFRTYGNYSTVEEGSDRTLVTATKTRSHMLSILTQMEHPVLFKPYLGLHPCRTAELLAQNKGSRNRVLTFISLMGPYIQLQLPNEYGLDV